MNEPAPVPGSAPTPEPAPIGALEALRRLRAAGPALLDQAGLHAQLAGLEFREERRRLARLLLIGALGVCLATCSMLFGGVLLMALSWDTALRVPSALLLLTISLIGLGVAWHRLLGLAALSDQAFVATFAELSADLALLRSKL